VVPLSIQYSVSSFRWREESQDTLCRVNMLLSWEFGMGLMTAHGKDNVMCYKGHWIWMDALTCLRIVRGT
jgi:hypothetical protein